MKRYLTLVLVCVSMIIGIVACSQNQKNEVVQEPTKEESLTLLKNALSSYSATITPQLETTRGRGFWKILKADAMGALGGSKFGWWGALGFAALYSICEYYSNEYSVAIEEVQIDVIPEQIGLPNDCVEILTGKLHNEIINNIFNKYPELDNMGIDQIVEIVFDETTLVSGVSDVGIRSEVEFISEINALKTIVKDGKHISDEVYTLYPEITTELEIIDIYCQTISNLEGEAEINDYTAEFIDIIQSSDIESETKTELVSGVVTGLNSNNLWELE